MRAKVNVDVYGIERVDTLEDLDWYPLRCAARFFHAWDDGVTYGVSTEYPGVKASTYTERCKCGRWRRRTVSDKTREILTVSYGGGQMVQRGTLDTRRAYVLWMQRQRKSLLELVPS